MFSDNMTPEELSNYEDNFLDSLNDERSNRWISVGEFDRTSKNKMLCSYSPPRGKNKDLFCGVEFVTGDCRVNWRCEEHKGRIGRGEKIMEQNLILKDSDKLPTELPEVKHLCTRILPNNIPCENRVQVLGYYCDSCFEVEEDSGAINPEYHCPFILSGGNVCNLIVLTGEVFCDSHLPRDKKTTKRVSPVRKEIEKSLWYSLEDFKKLNYTNLCTYSPFRGENKDKICGNKTTIGSKHCAEHNEMKGKIHTIVPELKIEPPKLPIVSLARWSSVKDYLTCIINGEMGLCAYSPFKGKNIDKICCNEIESYPEYVPPIWKLRCSKCRGKKGVGQTIILNASLTLLKGEKIPEIYIPKEVKIHTPEEEPEENGLIYNKSLQDRLGESWYFFSRIGDVFLAKVSEDHITTIYGVFENTFEPSTVSFSREMLKRLYSLSNKQEDIFREDGMETSYPSEVCASASKEPEECGKEINLISNESLKLVLHHNWYLLPMNDTTYLVSVNSESEITVYGNFRNNYTETTDFTRKMIGNIYSLAEDEERYFSGLNFKISYLSEIY